MLRLLLPLIVAVCAMPAQAMPRSKAARAEFVRSHPCPATGHKRGACPGYVVDHVVPLCAGGPDHHTNMQWQTVAAAKAKDREEARQCAAKRRK